MPNFHTSFSKNVRYSPQAVKTTAVISAIPSTTPSQHKWPTLFWCSGHPLNIIGLSRHFWSESVIRFPLLFLSYQCTSAHTRRSECHAGFLPPTAKKTTNNNMTNICCSTTNKWTLHWTKQDKEHCSDVIESKVLGSGRGTVGKRTGPNWSKIVQTTNLVKMTLLLCRPMMGECAGVSGH